MTPTARGGDEGGVPASQNQPTQALGFLFYSTFNKILDDIFENSSFIELYITFHILKYIIQ